MSESEGSVQATADELSAQREALISRDHAIGAEAEVGRLNREVTKMHLELVRTKSRLKKVTNRRDALAERLEETREELRTVRRRNAALRARVDELEAAPRSFARRAAGRLRRALR